jgi:hypothetical protein
MNLVWYLKQTGIIFLQLKGIIKFNAFLEHFFTHISHTRTTSVYFEFFSEYWKTSTVSGQALSNFGLSVQKRWHIVSVLSDQVCGHEEVYCMDKCPYDYLWSNYDVSKNCCVENSLMHKTTWWNFCYVFINSTRTKFRFCCSYAYIISSLWIIVITSIHINLKFLAIAKAVLVFIHKTS